MLKPEIKSGGEYAIRESPKAGSPIQRVRIVGHIRGHKWKVQWIDPNPGLVDYAESRQLIVPWKGLKAFLKEETASERLREHNRHFGYNENSPVVKALYEVFESLGDDVDFYKGVLTGSLEALGRVKTRAGTKDKVSSPAAYLDRQGIHHLPFDDALDLAKSLCAAEPSTVLVNIEASEREWSQRASRPGEGHMIGLLNEYRAAWALIRQWAGF
jgi:hypothetical protein